MWVKESASILCPALSMSVYRAGQEPSKWQFWLPDAYDEYLAVGLAATDSALPMLSPTLTEPPQGSQIFDYCPQITYPEVSQLLDVRSPKLGSQMRLPSAVHSCQLTTFSGSEPTPVSGRGANEVESSISIGHIPTPGSAECHGILV